METLDLLLSSSRTPPAFVYLHHPHQPTSSLKWPARGRICKVDAVESCTPKLLWSAIISRLEGKDAGVMDTMDMFLRALRTLQATSTAKSATGKDKGKGKAKAATALELEPVCIVITKAERLPKVLGHHWTALTRLAELVSPSLPPLPAMPPEQQWTDDGSGGNTNLRGHGVQRPMGRATSTSRRRARTCASVSPTTFP